MPTVWNIIESWVRNMLLDYYAHACVIMESERTNDGEGGWVTVWKECGEFTAYQALNTTAEIRVAQRDGLTSVYDILVDQNVPLKYDDYYHDKESGETFHVTSEPREKQSPASSSLNLKYYNAEKVVSLP